MILFLFGACLVFVRLSIFSERSLAFIFSERLLAC